MRRGKATDRTAGGRGRVTRSRTSPTKSVSGAVGARRGNGGSGAGASGSASPAAPTDSAVTEPTCGVCFDVPKLRGKLSCCEHVFCFACIKTWSERANTCPVCVRRFDYLDKVSAVPAGGAGRAAAPVAAGRKRKRAEGDAKPAKVAKTGERVPIAHRKQRSAEEEATEQMLRSLHAFPPIFGMSGIVVDMVGSSLTFRARPPPVIQVLLHSLLRGMPMGRMFPFDDEPDDAGDPDYDGGDRFSAPGTGTMDDPIDLVSSSNDEGDEEARTRPARARRVIPIRPHAPGHGRTTSTAGSEAAGPSQTSRSGAPRAGRATRSTTARGGSTSARRSTPRSRAARGTRGTQGAGAGAGAGGGAQAQ